MTINLRYSDDTRGPKSNPGKSQNSGRARKALSLLRAYVHAPTGRAAEAIGNALASFQPLPSPREAVKLTDKFPALVQSQALIRFSAFQEAAQAPEVSAAPLTVAEWGKAQDARAAREEWEFPALPGESRDAYLTRKLRHLMGEIRTDEGQTAAERIEGLADLAGRSLEEIQAYIDKTWPVIPADAREERRVYLQALANGHQAEAARAMASGEDWTAMEGEGHQDKPAELLVTPDRPGPSIPARVRLLAQEATEATQKARGLSSEALEKWAEAYAILIQTFPEQEAREVYANLVRRAAKVIPKDRIPDWKAAQSGEGRAE